MRTILLIVLFSITSFPLIAQDYSPAELDSAKVQFQKDLDSGYCYWYYSHYPPHSDTYEEILWNDYGLRRVCNFQYVVFGYQAAYNSLSKPHIDTTYPKQLLMKVAKLADSIDFVGLGNRSGRLDCNSTDLINYFFYNPELDTKLPQPSLWIHLYFNASGGIDSCTYYSKNKNYDWTNIKTLSETIPFKVIYATKDGQAVPYRLSLNFEVVDDKIIVHYSHSG